MLNLKDALRMKGIQIRDHASDQNEIRINCPFCSDTKFRLGINVSTGEAHCFNCDWSSKKVTKVLMKQFNLVGVSTEKIKEEKKELEEIEIPEGARLIGNVKNPGRGWMGKAYTYLEERGVTRQDMLDKQVMFTEVGRYSHRVLFPVVVKRRLVGLVGRGILKTQTPKYLNTKGIKAVWNIPDNKYKDSVILCEGIFKALKLEKMLDRFTVGALLGHSITDIQIEQIKKAELVLIWPDPDPPGLLGAIKIAYKLRERFNVSLPAIIPTKQADEMDDDEVMQVFRSFKPFTEALRCRYKFQAIKRSRED